MKLRASFWIILHLYDRIPHEKVGARRENYHISCLSPYSGEIVLREIEKDKMGISTWLRVTGGNRKRSVYENSVKRILRGERMVLSGIIELVRQRALVL